MSYRWLCRSEVAETEVPVCIFFFFLFGDIYGGQSFMKLRLAQFGWLYHL